MLTRIVSGGQTGVDRGALNAALAAGIDAGGWCPKGRRAEDGAIPDKFPVQEMESADYAHRTKANVRDSDATLILTHNPKLSGGTKLTRTFAVELKKPHLWADPAGDLAEEARRVADWMEAEQVHVLNVAGPRESGEPGIQGQAEEFVASLVDELKGRAG
ncbi:MAG: putative molybdenum carrier protein [Hyphomicrobiaceae bacterium]|nr:putative molybdenum carrier protein [Hyphomicrobiaceae bacterium]